MDAHSPNPSWNVFHRHWPKLSPPLRPTPEVAAAMAAAIAGGEARVLMLGVTPVIAGVGNDLTAVDWNANMIAEIWPGDSANRRAIEADWRAMPFEDERFTAVIGDGSFNCLAWPQGYAAVFEELARVLAPGARFAVRFFLTPSQAEPVSAVRAGALTGKIATIDALKWRLAMAIAGASDNPNMTRSAIYDAFAETFPDRAAFLATVGWEAGALSAIDWYKGAKDAFSFPTREQVLETVPACFAGARFADSGDYEMAERCPILVMDFAP